MSCLSPILLKKRITHSKSYGHHVVPCNKCPPCKLRISAGWVFRLKQEYKECLTATFLTCTYNDESLTYTQDGESTLNYEDHILFVNRLRSQVLRKYKQKVKIKYFCAAEYGEDHTRRPHFHYIMYNLPEELTSQIYDRDLKHNVNHAINEIWGKGHVDIDDVNGGSISYVVGYMHKKANLPNQIQDLDSVRAKEKRFMSQGLGLSYLTPKRIEHLQKNLEPYLIIPGNQKIPTPPYYRHKLYNKLQQGKINKKAQTFIEKYCQVTDYRKDVEQKKNIIFQYKRKLNHKKQKL